MNCSTENPATIRRQGCLIFRFAAAMPMIVAACLPISSLAQTNSNLDAVGLAPKVPSPEQGNLSTSPAKQGTPLNETPSRYITDEEAGPYVQSIAASRSILNRTTDPFGQLQDPNAEPAITPGLDIKSPRITKMHSTPFVDIVRQIKVTTIMPMEKKFLVGTRSIKQGQQFPINYRSKNINVKVLSVSSRQIEFRNLDSGETAALSLDLLPPGMTPGTKGIIAPGMQQNVPNAPLEIESGNNPTDNSPIANP